MGKHRVDPIARWLRPISLAAVMAAGTLPAFGRDLDGRYRESPLHDWFEHLASRKGLCCSFADGYVVRDADWETMEGHYRVRVPKSADSSDASVRDAAAWEMPRSIAASVKLPASAMATRQRS